VRPAIFVLRVRDGEIVESRDYFDHLSVGQQVGHVRRDDGRVEPVEVRDAVRDEREQAGGAPRIGDLERCQRPGQFRLVGPDRTTK
jgi:hypothetical protein